MTELGILAIIALVVFVVMLMSTKRGIGSLPVRAAPLMTKRERVVCAMIERAVRPRASAWPCSTLPAAASGG